MSHEHPYGKALNVLSFSKDNKVLIDEDAMKKMFEHPDVKNRKIVSFSIIGAYRKGKSFFLDYCLRFLYAHYPSINFPNNLTSDKENWMGAENEPLSGFSWRSGSIRDTTGIIMWSDIFLHTSTVNGDKIAIIVMDTQGLFDNQTSPVGNSRIFALGTLSSSIEVLNLFSVVQEDQLQYLQFATEFAKFAANDSHGNAGKSFQKLVFLIRDWVNPDEHPFGFEGGATYLQHFLKIQNEQKPELQSVRKFIQSSFEEIDCALLPHPGNIVTGGSRKRIKYNGSWGGMSEDFKDELFAVIETLLKPDDLIIKKINDKDLKGFEYLEFMLQYFQIFQSDDIPQAQSIYESTVEKQINMLVESCVENYKETIYKNTDLITNVTQIPIFHNMSKNQAMLMYNESKKMGNISHEIKFSRILSEKIDKIFQEWSDRSEKNMKKIEEETERTRLALEEKQKAEIQQIESEKRAAEELNKLNLLNAEAKNENYLKDKEIAEVMLKAEKERVAMIEAAKEKETEFRKQLQAMLEEEKRNPRVVNYNTGPCTIL
ncbi:hypothetical protein ACKWTF_016327 [Chironomus riparius]